MSRWIDTGEHAPTAEQRAFMHDAAPLAAIRAPPRGGKTTALKLRAAARGQPVYWAAPYATSVGLPAGSRVITIARLCAEVSVRHPTLLGRGSGRVLDREEIRRVFQMTQEGKLPGPLAPWLAAYRAAKRLPTDRCRARLYGLTLRYGLIDDSYSAPEELERAIAETDNALERAGLRSPQDLVQEMAHRVHVSREIAQSILPDGVVLVVDDAQTLSAAEMSLVYELARQQCRIDISIGAFQCSSQRDGAVALTWDGRLREAGFSTTFCREAVGLTTSQSRRLVQTLNRDREPPFDGLADLPFTVRFMPHEDEDALTEALAASIKDRLRHGTRAGDIAVLGATPELTEVIGQRLAEHELPIQRRGRGCGEGAPGFIVANALVRVMRDPRDVVSLRQVSLLFVHDRAAAEAMIQAALDRGCSMERVASEAGEQTHALEMIDMCQALRALREAGPAGVGALIRQAPYWPGDSINEEGVAWWEQRVMRAGLPQKWDDPRWIGVLVLTADPIDERPLPSDRIPLLPIADSCGMQWKFIDIVGMSHGVLPGLAPSDERQLELQALVHALSRARAEVQLHHAAEMRLDVEGPLLKLKASTALTRLGFDVPAEMRPQGAPKFKMRELMRQ